MPGYTDARKIYEINVANGTTEVDKRRGSASLAISL